MIFKDRVDAGKKLAEELSSYQGNKNTIIVFLPRGGVTIGYEVKKKLKLPMDLVVPRKIGAPRNPEFAIGAIDETGRGIFSKEDIGSLRISKKYLKETIEKEKKEAQRRLSKYRGNKRKRNFRDKTIIIVDDGIATGLTMRAAINSVKSLGAKKIIVAVPVAARDSADIIRNEVDEMVVLSVPDFFGAVGAFYKVFPQVSDAEVIEIMKK